MLSRALVSIFEHPFLGKAVAFRGGTALYKLFLRPPPRFSEDLDLVQVEQEPARILMDTFQDVMTPWLGKASYDQTQQSIKFEFRYESENTPLVSPRLKLEIKHVNTLLFMGTIKSHSVSRHGALKAPVPYGRSLWMS